MGPVDAAGRLEIARALFREASDAFFVFDPGEGRVVDANPAALRLTGFDRPEVLAMRIEALFAAEADDDIRRLVEALRRTQLFHAREGYSLARREGGPIAVNLSVSRVHTRPEPLGLVVARDVTELRRTHKVLELFFRNSPALFAVIGMDGRIRAANPAWRPALGYSPDELVGMSPWDLVDPDDRAEALAAVSGRPRGETSAFEAHFRRKGGGLALLSWCAGTIDGQTYAVALDISEREAAELLRRDKEAAEAASTAKGRLLANVSHELRTPLAAMLGLLDVLLEGPEAAGAPALADDLRAIRRNGSHLIRLIEDLLDLSQVESGRLELKPAPCRPADIVAEVVELLGTAAEAKGLALAADYAASAPETVLSDETRLRQILLNLVSNAIKYTESGRVTLRGGLAEPGPGTGTPRLRFDVVDTGVGLTPEEIAGLFQPFHRGDARAEGVGLGLSISRKLAELLGGTLEVRSEPGWGSTFRLELPAVAAVASESEPAPPEPPDVEGRTPRVLLAEDHPDNRRAATLRLQMAGVEVLAVDDGQQAIDAALAARDQGRPFDAILMDIHMPVVDGFEATSRLRAAGYRGRIIALTAYARPEDREECLRRGCDEHAAKPVDWGRIFRLIGQGAGEPP